MLARLLAVPGVLDARVECTGTYFALELDPARAEAALAAVLARLGAAARRLDPGAASAQLEARGRGELWFSAADVRALSYLEGRVLTARLVAGVLAEVALDAAVAEVVSDRLRAELFAALDEVHEDGGCGSSGWLAERWPRIAAGLASRLEGKLPRATADAVVARLAALGPQA